jgi:TP901 family phage tail tape measure protein
VHSFVNVQVRILAAQAAAQLAALQSRVNGLEKSFRGASRGSSLFGMSLHGMRLDTFGSRLQWIGRQLEYNFTIPILAAAAASFKLALDNEKAFTRVTKVYGDAAHGAQEYSMELEALQKNFVALSNAYGVNQTETIEIAAQWAAAGASGLALAKSVDLTMQTMILGEMEAAEATEALIAIQAQYGQDVEQLTKTIATLNMVENQTGISLAGLVQGFARAAGIARDAGVDVRHLAAMLAALTPAAGSAAQAGNALKTIFSRLVAPTQETVEVLGLMGINISDLSWKSATATDRLMILARSFESLDKAQQNVVSSVIASRWQVNKFSVLMRELTNENGYYQKALQGTNDQNKVFLQMQKELNAVLESNPRRLQIIWTTLQNAAADIITPLIPLLLYLAEAVQRVVQAFSELPPGVQKFVVVAALALAAFGLLIRVGGAAILLVAELAGVFRLLLIPIGAVTTALWTLVKVPVIKFFAAMSFAVRYAIAGLMMLPRLMAPVLFAVQVALLRGAAAAGIVWRAGFGLITTISMGVLTALTVIVTRGMAAVQAAVLAGARLAGIAWRAGLVAITAIQLAWNAVMAISWSTLFVRIGAIVAGGFTALLGLFRGFIPALRAFSFAAVAALTGPWGIAITAVIALLIAFWDELKALWSVLVRGTIAAFNALPAGIRNAMIAVVTVIQRAAMAVYNAMQWMNPWARHSPSLVENVTTGVAEIKKQYSGLSRLEEVFRKAGMSLQEFGKIVERLKRVADLQEIANQRSDLADIAADAIPEFDRLVKLLFPLRDLLGQIGRELAAQQTVVDGWKQKLDAANRALDEQQNKLKQLQDVAAGYKDQLDAAQAELDRFANAPIEGMKAMEDAIFANEMQQKSLRLEMMKLEDAVGPLDQLQGKIDAINGSIELLSGEQAALRAGGAGGEILSQYDQQIDLLEQQRDVIQEQIQPIQDLADQIEDLGREAEMLDLEKSLAFDPLTRQIDDLINSMEEMPFDEILAGVIENKAEVDRLTEAYNEANKAVADQQAIVDQLTAQRDLIQASYDLEVEKLQAIQDEYDQVEEKVRAIEDALRDMSAAARDAADSAGSMSPGAANFLASEGGNFPDPGGFDQIGREGGWEDQSALIDEFTKEMMEKTKNMFGLFNFLDPIKKGWNTAWGWVKENIGGTLSNVGSAISDAVGGMNPFEGAGEWMKVLKDVGNTVKEIFKIIWDAIGPDVIEVAKQAWAGLKDAFADIQPEIEKFRDLIGPAGKMIQNIFTFLKPAIMVVLGLLLLVIKVLLNVIANTIGPAIRMIGDIIAGAIKIIRGLIEFIVGVFTLDWDMAWQGIVDIFSGIWQIMSGILKNAVSALWGIVKGLVEGIVGFFTWLWDVLVGHSIVPDIVNGILKWFNILKDAALKVFNTLVEGIRWAFNNVIKPIFDGWGVIINKLKELWTIVVSYLKGKWDELVQKVQAAVGLIRAAIDTIKGIWNTLTNAFKSVVDAVKGWIDKFVSNFNAIKSRFSFGGMFDGIKGAFKAAINWVIGKWNDLEFTIGGGSFAGVTFPSMTIGTPNVGYLAKGGMITRGAVAVIGEGRPGYPEYVIPTDPFHRARALRMFSELGGELGASQRRTSTLVYQPENKTTNLNFYGDLEFPNVKDGSDAEEFIRNLEALIGEA